MLQMQVHLIVIIVNIIFPKIEIAVYNFSLEDLMSSQQRQLLCLDICLEDVTGKENTITIKKLRERLLLHAYEIFKALTENLYLLLAYVIQKEYLRCCLYVLESH